MENPHEYVPRAAADMQFVLRELAGVDEIAKLPGYEDTTDVLDAILDEASTFATEFSTDQPVGRQRGLYLERRRRHDAEGFRKRTRASRRPAGSGFVPTDTAVKDCRRSCWPTLEMWNAATFGFCQRSAAQSRRDRSDRTVRQRRAEADLHHQTGER